MASRTDEDDTEERSERQTLLLRGDHAKIDPAALTDEEAHAKEAAACERLIRARKSLTRSHPIEESFDYAAHAADAETAVNINTTAIAEEVEHSDCGSVAGSIHDHNTDLPPTNATEDEEGALDNLSASLSALRMDKFALEKRRVSRILPRCLHPAFVDPDVENLFQVFHERQRRGDMRLLLVAGILLAAYSFALLLASSNLSPDYLPISLFCIFAVLHLLLLCLLQVQGFPELGWSVAPYVVWLLCVTELLLLVAYSPLSIAPRQTLLWMLLLAFLYLAALPLRLIHALVMSVMGSVLYILVASLVQKHGTFSWTQVIGSLLLGTGATLLGLMSYFFADKKHRRAFLETRQSLESKMVIEDESKEQERLLLSVLPKHVAETMRRDLGRGGDGQFKKIYMSRHENVSILFADIVGFTAISSTYTASELVKMLNELFARFDGLADKYKQMRIKILGDCYYCISGAPKERPDHAILSVHMGLSMIEAIKYVRENTGCTVDMRVGIHTGAVLAGVLGQRQWQFDVYSKDVILANKMESSGKPGRVHVSNTTQHFLNDHFEVEPAFGERREDSLRAACLKTYFISKVLIPHKPRPSLGLIKNGAKTNSSSQPSKEQPSDNTMVSRDSVTLSTQEESRARCPPAEQGRNSFTKKLQRELVSRDGRKDLLNKISVLTLVFRDPKVETAFRQHRETFSGAAATALPLILFIVALVRFIVLTRAGGGLLVFFIGFAIVLSLTFVPAASSFPLPVCGCIENLSLWMHASQWRRSLCFSLLMFISASIVMADMFLCDKGMFPDGGMPRDDYGVLPPVLMPVAHNVTKRLPLDDRNDTEPMAPETTLDTYTDPLMSQAHFRNCTLAPKHPHLCPLPDYYTYFLLLILLASSLLSQMNYVFKNFMFFIAAVVQCLLNLSLMRPIVLSIFYCMDLFPRVSWLTESVLLSSQLCLITLILIFLNRQMEKASRLLYLWRREVEEQKERAEEFRQRNESLVYNMLPRHVAIHFMGMRKQKHEELYSQSYEEVGVLFASMPNFGDFYSEDSVNNQGLECLRFLNEVISDFDGLLEKRQFRDIIKIKTIGSTYMATSGLNPPRPAMEHDPIKVRWAHLGLLVDFAFELIRAIQSINEQSFNHFVLRMGINHGPITAGVIGARKPHYDIWGNTVNVASRMESTGKAGCIQVTEDTMKILHHFGYIFEQRGLINVKGKGELMTYYLVGKGTSPQGNGESNPLYTPQTVTG